jgi:hypothetical protein
MTKAMSADSRDMTRRLLLITPIIMLIFGLAPAPAAADVTAFWGVSPTPSTRGLKGFSAGLGLIIVGFEGEYSATSEDKLAPTPAPGLKTWMFNGVVQTPTRVQLYLTAGGGVFRERVGTETETGIGTNIGGGLKIPLLGPFRLRLDYRVFTLRGQPISKTPQRFYAGANLRF